MQRNQRGARWGNIMNKTNNKRLTKNAQTLRRYMTKEERCLWYDFLKGLPVTVNRQKVIGRYIADFYCAEAKIVIELDGSQHNEEDSKSYDEKRDAYLNSLGITVLRYTNVAIRENFPEVCKDIKEHIFPPASP